MYEYRATIIRVVDGDTVDCSIDLGFGISQAHKLRLAHINAPERGTPEGSAAAAFLKTLLPVGLTLTLRSEKDRGEKYGRYLANLIESGLPFRIASVNDQMVQAGHAVRYEIGAR